MEEIEKKMEEIKIEKRKISTLLSQHTT